MTETYDYICLLYRLSNEALEVMLRHEDDKTKRVLIEGELNARKGHIS